MMEYPRPKFQRGDEVLIKGLKTSAHGTRPAHFTVRSARQGFLPNGEWEYQMEYRETYYAERRLTLIYRPTPTSKGKGEG